jgi:hypothetical protein
MPRRSTVKPDWLDRMLIGWGCKSLHTQGRGWYSINPMLKDGIPTGRAPSEPYELGAEDFRELDRCIEALSDLHKLAITRAYKPWSARAIDEQFPCGSSTWSERLKAAASILELKMRRDVVLLHALPN